MTAEVMQYRRANLTYGGHNGSYGRCYVFCREAGLGQAFNDMDDLYTAVARLLDVVEARWHIPVVMGTLVCTDTSTTLQQDLISDDKRKRVAPKPKPKYRRRDPRGYE